MAEKISNEMLFTLLSEFKTDVNRRFDEIDKKFDEIRYEIREVKTEQRWLRNKIEDLWETRKELKLSFDRAYFPRFASSMSAIALICYVVFEIGKKALGF